MKFSKYLSAWLGASALIGALFYYAYADSISQQTGVAVNRYSSNVPTTTWVFLRDAIATNINGRGVLATGLYLFDNSTYEAIRGTSTGNQTATVTEGVLLTAPHATWSVTNTPAVNTQATASRAAGAAGVSHVPTHVTACISGTAVAAPVQVNLRDGATGAGTIIWSAFLGVDTINANSCAITPITLPPGTAATAMTLEFAAAGGANTNETVTLAGYSVN